MRIWIIIIATIYILLILNAFGQFGKKDYSDVTVQQQLQLLDLKSDALNAQGQTTQDSVLISCAQIKQIIKTLDTLSLKYDSSNTKLDWIIEHGIFPGNPDPP